MTPELRKKIGVHASQLLQTTFVSLDPAVGNPAFALFDRGTLLVAKRVKLPPALSDLTEDDCDGERCRHVAATIVADIRKVAAEYQIEALVFEQPKIYDRAREASKGDPRNMIKLTLVCGGVASLLDVPTLSPEPGVWSGGTRKVTKGNAWDSPRGTILKRIVCKGDEAAAIEANHDSIDAACIGMWALGRFGKFA